MRVKGSMRRHQLDGVRFVLFLMVFATHYAENPVEVGYLGYALPVFFVMSGFLITNVLLASGEPSLWGRLKTFYLRRILRICPAYYLVVLLLITFGAISFPGYYLAYLMNIKLFTLSLVPDSGAFQEWFIQGWKAQSMHLWSLSVEEQFYIVYPLVLYLTPARFRTVMLVSVVIASVAARYWFANHYPGSFYGTLLPVCAEYFAWGCLFSWLEGNNRLQRLSPNWTLGLSSAAVVVLIGTEYYLKHNGFLQFVVSHYQTPIALSMGFFIWSLWSINDSHMVARILSWRPLVYFGEMSYTLYLVHLLALDLFLASGIGLPFEPKTDLLIGGFCTSILMAMAIWHLVEKPAYSLRRFVPYTKRQPGGSSVGTCATT